MYILSHRHQYIFIHLPKVAGNSMKRLFIEVERSEAKSDFLYRQYFEIRRTGIHLASKPTNMVERF